MHINFEFKARCNDIDRLESILLRYNPVFIGVDRQVDTYFHVPFGRLKLREGILENALIHYERSNLAGPKQSDVTLYSCQKASVLKEALVKALGIKVVVDKTRKIYFIGNVKFHFDEVIDLGSFVEVEAIDKEGTLGLETIKSQCEAYAKIFEIDAGQFIAESYSELLAKKSSTTEDVSASGFANKLSL
jgi:predicted adenylyl cyclase CyaB